MNDELGRIWKKAVVTSSEKDSIPALARRLRKINEKSVRIADDPSSS